MEKMQIRAFGYSVGDTSAHLAELREITFAADPASLRAIAAFLAECATEMECNPAWDHRHLSDASYGVGVQGPDLIIASPSLVEG